MVSILDKLIEDWLSTFKPISLEAWTSPSMVAQYLSASYKKVVKEATSKEKEFLDKVMSEFAKVMTEHENKYGAIQYKTVVDFFKTYKIPQELLEKTGQEVKTAASNEKEKATAQTKTAEDRLKTQASLERAKATAQVLSIERALWQEYQKQIAEVEDEFDYSYDKLYEYFKELEKEWTSNIDEIMRELRRAYNAYYEQLRKYLQELFREQARAYNAYYQQLSSELKTLESLTQLIPIGETTLQTLINLTCLTATLPPSIIEGFSNVGNILYDGLTSLHQQATQLTTIFSTIEQHIPFISNTFKMLSPILSVLSEIDYIKIYNQITRFIDEGTWWLFETIGIQLAVYINKFVEPFNYFFGSLISTLLTLRLEESSNRLNTIYLSVFEALRASLEYEPPATFQKAKHSIANYLERLFTFTNLGGLVGFICDSIGNIEILGTKLGIRGIGRWVNSIYWNLGLGWLTWSLFGSVIRATITEPVEAYYKLLYRPKLLTQSECEEAVMNGVMNVLEYRSILACHGYNEDSIDVIIANIQKKIADKMETIETQIADLEEDIAKIENITIPDYKDKIDKTKEKLEVTISEIKRRKEQEYTQLQASYIPKLNELENEIKEIRDEYLKIANIEVNKIKEQLKIELEKISKQKEIETKAEKIKTLQIKEWELQREAEVKINAILSKAEEQASIKAKDIVEQFNKLKEEYNLKLKALEKKYEDEERVKTYTLKYDIERYTRLINYYENIKKQLIHKKINRLRRIYNRLSMASAMSTIEDLDQFVEKTLLKKKKLIPIEEKEKKD